MKKIVCVVTLLGLSSLSFAASYPTEAQVRSTCLRNFARTITCKAVVEGRTLSVDLDKETVKATSINYFEHGVATLGFSKKASLISNYPRWEISCNQITGALTGTRYAVRQNVDVVHSVPSVCR